MVDSSSSGGRTWFITGISKGIGTEIAVQALKHGDTVIGTVRSQDLPKSLQNQKKLHVLTLDVTDEQKTKDAVTKALELANGKIDVLVNNAGAVTAGALEEVPLTQWRQQFELNVFALVHITQLILPSMRKNNSGHIINLSSVAGRSSGPGWGPYCSSKYAVEAISESLAQEVKSFGIKVTLIEPGYIRTPILSSSGTTFGKNLLPEVYDGIRESEADVNKISGTQAGDPVRVGKVIYDVSKMSSPPLHLPLGSDAFAGITSQLQSILDEIKPNKELSESTDYPKEK